MERVSLEAVRQAQRQYGPLILFCNDRENGLVTVTLGEYLKFPPIVRICWKLYCDIRKQIEKKHEQSRN